MPKWYDDEVFRSMSPENQARLERYRPVVKYIESQGFRVLSFGPGVQFSKPETPDSRFHLGPGEMDLFLGLLEKVGHAPR